MRTRSRHALVLAAVAALVAVYLQSATSASGPNVLPLLFTLNGTLCTTR
jgi:hypothetical protein